MVVKVEISEETWARLLTGKRVEGTMGYDTWTGRKTFRMFHRMSRLKPHDRLIRRMEHGWVKESKERIKVYESVPKELGTARVISILERESSEAKSALIERELDIIEFC
jgi:hypothetical protein